jgi:AraC-like DNA-binding protein
MHYRELAAPRELASLVSVAWVQVTRTEPLRTVPSGCVELTCALGAGVRVVGPRTGPLVQTVPSGTTVAGIRLTPGAAAAVLGMPPAALTDSVVDAAEVFGNKAATQPQTVAEALHLLRRLITGHDHEADPIIAATMCHHEFWQVGAASSQVNMSDSQLRRRFVAATGLPPKTMFRIMRFQGFLGLVQRHIARGEDPLAAGLASLAAQAGYADQPHLTRECARLTGVTPQAFLRQTATSCGAGHDHGISTTRSLNMAGLIKS